mmetsp:Transcript_84491/g.243951  ORF Transcript_84491/g.243951 Transcript_84491/m.243951 type:complete len:153 (-) Transcript_84491:239-697(-)|eukprot:CAMPEP_0170214616 /NCGR_PEP_ID=MMETSP0116_2-20130129/6940_1 /TAXON_ID=400756 /ORGANISM="Durinskia baltica, Strain CSIRO CS-38" /LENGTH=152 /DNA_ID=CAMNT_0010465183 /DNA_START=72 /DNA_END=530 /DNA_ORIENTATION=+
MRMLWTIGLVFPLLFEGTSAFAILSSRPCVCTRLNLYKSVEEAIEEAQRICDEDPNSPACQVAWDIVEELEAADSHKDAQERIRDSQYSMDFEALLRSFDILTAKLDNKMDQLIATCDKFEEWGADPSVAELSRLAEEMKRGMAYVKDTLRQ